LIPSLSKNAPQDLATLQHAIAAVDLGALDADNPTKFDASLAQARKELEPLKPMLKQATLYLTGNSHIDAAWLWPWTESVDVVKRTFGTALQLMNEYPDYTYTQSAAQYNEWIANKYPEMNEEIKKRIKEGRWEVVGGMWVEPDLNMPDGESQVRSLLLGKRFFQKQYGVDVRIGWNPADLQALRRRLLCHPEDGVERHQPAPLQALLVGVARWQQGPDLLPS
jgi:alpha-mannosidase